MNFYGSEQFKEYFKEHEKRIFTNCDMTSPTEEDIGQGYCLRRYYYEEPFEPGSFSIHYRGEICRLYKDSDAVFEWKCCLGHSHVKMIDHSNGRHYLIFNEDLYGYGVLDLETYEAVHYLPWESYQSGDSFEETFIWITLHYDRGSDLLAVGGCFWAESGGSVIVLDFKDPMKIVEADKWLDIGKLAAERSGYDVDFNFVSWEKDRLVCSSFEIEKKELFELINNGKQ